MGYQWRTVLRNWPDLLHGLGTTVSLALLAFLLALVLALVAAVGRNSHNKVLRAIASVYVEAIRNTPVLLQIYIVYFGLPSLGIRFNAYTAGVIALGVNIGAYLAETLRAGLNDVPHSQVEASEILGLNKATIFWIVVLPQAIRKVYPTIVNYLIVAILGTSLMSGLALTELTGTGLIINSRTLLWVQVFTILLVLYLILSFVFSTIGSVVGQAIFKPPLEGLRRSVKLPNRAKASAATVTEDAR